MAGLLRNIAKKSLIIINAAAGISMLLLYTLPYSNPDYFWMLNIIALAFPLLLMIQIVFLFFWLVVKPRIALFPIFFCVLSYKLIFSAFSVLPAQSASADTAKGISVFSWNVHLFNFFEKGGRPDASMISKVKKLNADIFCAQELVFSLQPNSSFTLEKLKKQLGFSYVVAANDRSFGVHTDIHTINERYHPFCLAIFSKHPIIQWKKIQTIPEYNHTFLWADIKTGNDTVRVFNIHLQSMYFAKNDYEFIEHIDQQNVDQVSNHGKSILRKVKNANYLRAIQMKEVKKEILKSPHPVILTGDFNDVPNSYAYQQVNRDLTDAFLAKGRGIGRTFAKLSPTLRIDYIFTDPSLPLNEFHIHNWNMSDHYGIEASISLPDTK
jgi:endonuclease/exonuclease/phosphatase family metal-dependent hydrolase